MFYQFYLITIFAWFLFSNAGRTQNQTWRSYHVFITKNKVLILYRSVEINCALLIDIILLFLYASNCNNCIGYIGKPHIRDDKVFYSSYSAVQFDVFI